ncbi:uncharacterized protein LOC128230797 [Mya arenaria]|uniref:uncharacterized protein LOC128230797 n=1 Tax=Mya arenaria TaxID=6604 RepID=UPI0022DFC868|nr:uncharacterized protein LOC128230797 [Mya arenaria]
MTCYRDLLSKKDTQNWIKAALALNITKEGLQDFVENVLTCVHKDIFSTVSTSKSLPSGAICAHCFTENVLKCPTRGICTSTRICRFHNTLQPNPCPKGICEDVRDEIIQHHRFTGPSWKNTNADKWCTSPWEIGKCFLPPDGYKTVPSIKESDFNGVLSVMLNCADFETKLSFNVATTTNLLTEVRDIGRRVRHSNDQQIKDTELVDFLFKLRTLLEDKTELANRPEAHHAVEQLKKLQTDDFKISSENQREMLKEGLRLRLTNHYKTTLADMPISPILVEKNAKLSRFYVAPKITEKDHRKLDRIDKKERSKKNANFSDVFCKNGQFLSNVFLVGEPGTGKSTFSVMCALEWTQQYLPAEENVGIKTSYADPEFFKEFAFLFHVTLRDSGKTCDVAEMIKDQLICKIYHEKDVDDGYQLLQTVLESEKCLIIADGLDEWTHPENEKCTCKADEKVTPFRNSANKATLLTTTRPWRLSQIRVQDSKIDKYLEIEGPDDPSQLVKNILTILNEDTENERTPEAFIRMVHEKGLTGLLTAPITLTHLVCLWFEGISLTNSKCDIYAGVINMLSCRHSCMRRELKEPKIKLPHVLTVHECFRQNPTIYLELAKLAYVTLFSGCRESSVVFSSDTVYATLDKQQVEFALKSGLLTEKKSNSYSRRSSHFTFFHKTLQEFLAALHLCVNGDDYNQLSSKYESDNKQYILGDVSQVFIYICGMKPELGVQMSSWINNSIPQCGMKPAIKVLMSMWSSFSPPHSSRCFIPYDNPFREEVPIPEDTELLQDMIVSGYLESQANNYDDTPLTLKHFVFCGRVNVSVLKKLIRININRIQTLLFDARINSEVNLHELITSSSDSLKAVDMLHCVGQYDLSQCHRLEYLSICGDDTTCLQVDTSHITTCRLQFVSSDVELNIFSLFKHNIMWSKLKHLVLDDVKNIQLMCDTLPSLPHLQNFKIQYTDLGELHLLPPASICHIELVCVTMTSEAVRRLMDMMENIPHTVECVMDYCMLKPDRELENIREHIVSSTLFNIEKFAIFQVQVNSLGFFDPFSSIRRLVDSLESFNLDEFEDVREQEDSSASFNLDEFEDIREQENSSASFDIDDFEDIREQEDSSASFDLDEFEDIREQEDSSASFDLGEFEDIREQEDSSASFDLDEFDEIQEPMDNLKLCYVPFEDIRQVLNYSAIFNLKELEAIREQVETSTLYHLRPFVHIRYLVDRTASRYRDALRDIQEQVADRRRPFIIDTFEDTREIVNSPASFNLNAFDIMYRVFRLMYTKM